MTLYTATSVRFPTDIKNYVTKVGVQEERSFSQQIIWILRQEMERNPLRVNRTKTKSRAKK